MKSIIMLCAVAACGAVIGCKSISVERVERTPILDGTNVIAVTERVVRGSYLNYGMVTSLEGLKVEASTNGFSLAIGKASTDVSERHAEIIDATGKSAGTIIGAAAAAAVK